MNLQAAMTSSEEFIKNFFQSMTEDMQMCIQNCVQCSQVCEQMIQHCLMKGGNHAELRHIRLLQDCSEICRVSADFMIRESHFHIRTCETCAEVCLACAADCERLLDDELMRVCADVCRNCAETCQKMSLRH
ncbi:MAG: four-helix bundle copper-binding protein [Pseudobdellovibrionaceae bacterium]